MRELKYKKFSKTLNYKILSTIPAVSAGMILTSTPTTAMFRNGFSFFSKLVQNSSTSGISSSIKKTSSSKPIKFFYNLSGSRIPVVRPTPYLPDPVSSPTKPISSSLNLTSNSTFKTINKTHTTSRVKNQNSPNHFEALGKKLSVNSRVTILQHEKNFYGNLNNSFKVEIAAMQDIIKDLMK